MRDIDGWTPHSRDSGVVKSRVLGVPRVIENGVREESVGITPCRRISVVLDENVYRSGIPVANRESDGSHRDIRPARPRKSAKPLDLSYRCENEGSIVVIDDVATRRPLLIARVGAWTARSSLSRCRLHARVQVRVIGGMGRSVITLRRSEVTAQSESYPSPGLRCHRPECIVLEPPGRRCEQRTRAVWDGP